MGSVRVPGLSTTAFLTEVRGELPAPSATCYSCRLLQQRPGKEVQPSQSTLTLQTEQRELHTNVHKERLNLARSAHNSSKGSGGSTTAGPRGAAPSAAPLLHPRPRPRPRSSPRAPSSSPALPGSPQPPSPSTTSSLLNIKMPWPDPRIFGGIIAPGGKQLLLKPPGQLQRAEPRSGRGCSRAGLAQLAQLSAKQNSSRTTAIRRKWHPSRVCSLLSSSVVATAETSLFIPALNHFVLKSDCQG